MNEPTPTPLRRGDDVRPSQLATGELDLTAFPGLWRSSDPRTRGIAQLRLTVDADGGVRGRIWGAGPRGLIDWGERRAHPIFTAGVASRTGAGFLLSYDFGFLQSHLEANLKLGVAVLCAYQSFQDRNGRRNYFFREFLARDPGDEPRPVPTVAGLSCGHDEGLGRGHAATTRLLLGHWRNTLDDTDGIPRITVEPDGEEVVVKVWGAATDGLVDWGETRGEIFTCAEEDDVPSAAVLARYTFDGMTSELQIRQNKGILAVTTFNHFTDGSGRSSYVTRELYHRDSGETS